jgi:DNA modification methylase
MKSEVLVGDCINVLAGMETDSVDLILCSPPYENARSYDMGFNLKGQEWVDWAVSRYLECARVSRGLVAWVVEGRTKDFRWTATPALLMADLHRSGIKLRKPPVYHRVGIPGSGGPDWWRNDYELIVCSSKGKLPWSNNTATGHAPKFPAGGAPSHQSRDGRVNRPRLQREGDTRRVRQYKPPERSNPGNLIQCHGGGGHMGSPLAHENEAPFPEKLAEAFVLSFCPPDGTVLDCFCGSGTTLAVANRHGRNAIGIDLRESQVALTNRRLSPADVGPQRGPSSVAKIEAETKSVRRELNSIPQVESAIAQ